MGLQIWWDRFEHAGQPTLTMLAGEFRSEFVGPLWLRAPAPLFLAVRGMPFWAGKRFAQPVDGVAHGVNLLEVRGFRKESLAVSAVLEDRDLVVRYPAGAPWPWPGVVDRLRPLDEETLLGMTFGLPLMPPQGAPFLLRRVAA